MLVVAAPTVDEIQEAINVVAREWTWQPMSDAMLAQVEGEVRHWLFAEHGDVDVKARRGYICNHQGPEGDCEWTLYEPDERCPFHGSTTRGTKINLQCTTRISHECRNAIPGTFSSTNPQTRSAGRAVPLSAHRSGIEAQGTDWWIEVH
jgi:hypothetical protein